MLRRVWVRVPPGAKDVLTTAFERGFTTFVVDRDDAKRFSTLGKFRLVVLDEAGLHEDGENLGPRVVISTVEDQSRALALAGRFRAVLVEARGRKAEGASADASSAKDWKIIPFENLIAAYRGKTQLVAPAQDVAEAKLLLRTLEIGVDAVLIEPKSAEETLGLARALAQESDANVSLTKAEVTSVRAIGVGDRVCLDTISLLGVGEGILVGSSAQALFLVHSESIESGYVAARPFRVNAGPVHAYTLLPNGKTRYLSELKGGDEVLAVATDGKARTVVLGRVKIETRPMLLVEARAEGRAISTIVQNAETIRLTTPTGAKSVTELAPGDEILVRVEQGGRHFGTHVHETILER